LDYTQVSLNIANLHVPNLILRGHRPLMQTAYSPELCKEVAEFSARSPIEVEVSFKTFLITDQQGRKSLQEEMSLDFPFGQMHSITKKILFQK